MNIDREGKVGDKPRGKLGDRPRGRPILQGVHAAETGAGAGLLAAGRLHICTLAH